MIRMFNGLVSCQGYFANIVQSKLPQLTVLCLGEMLKSRFNVNYCFEDSILSRCNLLKSGQVFIIIILVYFVGNTSYKTDRTIL